MTTTNTRHTVSFILFLLAFVFLNACVEMVTDIDFPDQDPKVVVYSFISPSDTAAMVMLSWSVPITSSDNNADVNFIRDAEVRMRNQKGEAALLTFAPSRQIYRISSEEFPIEAGNNYYLEIEVPGLELITASCYVPEANTSLRHIKTDTIPGEWSDRLMVEFSFTDPAVSGERFYAPSAWQLIDRYLESEMNPVSGRIEMSNIYGGKYISNKDKEGQDFLIRTEAYIYPADSWPGDPETPYEPQQKGLVLLLLTTDEHYYRFHKDLESYAPDNFFTEATLVYSNIRGGLGVFAGLSRTELLISP